MLTRELNQCNLLNRIRSFSSRLFFKWSTFFFPAKKAYHLYWH